MLDVEDPHSTFHSSMFPRFRGSGICQTDSKTENGNLKGKVIDGGQILAAFSSQMDAGVMNMTHYSLRPLKKPMMKIGGLG